MNLSSLPDSAEIFKFYKAGVEVVLRCSVKKVFLEVSQNSQENICARDGCFPVNMLHIFRTHFHKNASGGLLLYFQTVLFCFQLLNIG